MTYMRDIQKVLKINDFPSFIDFTPATDLRDFGKFNLLYGWNGSGKTTFSRILQCFEFGLNAPNNSAESAAFEFKLGDATSISSKDLSAFKEIRVFNKDFVENSVLRATGPKPIFFLGKETIEDKAKLTKASEDLASLIKDRDTKDKLLTKGKDARDKSLSLKAGDIKNALTSHRQDKYKNYDRRALEKAIKDHSDKLNNLSELMLSDAKLTTLKKSILQESGTNLGAPVTPSFDLSDLENRTKEILSKSIVSQIIESLKSDDEVGKWVEHGLGLHKSRSLDICAFCDQKILSKRLRDLENHFNDDYQKIIKEIGRLKQDCIARQLNLDPIDSSSFYEELKAEFIAEKAKAESAIKTLNTRLIQLISFLEQKEKNPFTNPSLPTATPIDAIAFLNINELILKNNEKTNNFEQKITSEKEQLELHYIAGFLPSYNSAAAECVTLEAEFNSLVEKVQAKEKEISSLKENLTNHHIAARLINDNLQSFLGRTDIQVKATDEKDGYRIMRNKEIANNLSEGEKTALAIVYFITKIKEDGFDLKNSVIVIDDPVSSLDSGALFQAFSFIKESIKEAGQIFILTHHFDFFRLVKNWFKHCSGKEFFMVVCKEEEGIRKSQILNIDPMLLKYESEYHFLFSVLYNFSEKKQTDLEQMYSLPNVARKFLESFLAFRVPILRDEEPNIYHRLKEIDFNETKKTRINRFVETHSHPRYESGVQDFDMTILAETPAIIVDLLAMVKKEDEKHYDFLEKSLTS